MYFLIFGKFNLQSKLLSSKAKIFLWNKEVIINSHAHKHKKHPKINNEYKNDVFFLEKVKIYQIDDMYEEDGDVIMNDHTKDMKYEYKEYEITNKSLSQIIEDIKISKKIAEENITIHLYNQF